ncbi:MAG TPA: hypothetical protein VLV78_15965 [Thermoanaerobaculia bacterium]|nr:hypothetical protein [Thermoanaerobaculia bacterium]
MIRHVIYLVEQPLDQRNFDRFGIQTLLDNGFDVSVIDCTQFRFPRVNPATPIIQTRRPIRTMACTSESQALTAISQMAAGTFVVNLLGYCPETYPVYKALSKMRVPYGVDVLNALPPPFENGTAVSRKVRQVLNVDFQRAVRTLAQTGRNILYRAKGRRLRGATFWFAGGSESPRDFFFPRDAQTRILWMHSIDYDLYLAEKDRPMEIADKAVFLDQYLPFHHDFHYEGRRNPVGPEAYYSRLSALFVTLERRLGLSTEVAGHPRSHSDDGYSRYFGGRPVIYSRTANLVKNSKLVIAHYSTAVNLAVLFRKPVLFVTTKQLQKSGQGVYIETTARWLGKKVVDLDGPLEHVDWDRELSVDEASYASYQSSFISTTEAPAVPSWQILADVLKQMD